MSLWARIKWLWQAVKTAWLAIRAVQVVTAALPPSKTGGPDIMTMVTVAQLKSLAGLLGGGAAQQIAKGVDGKAEDALVAIEDVVAMVGVFWPPAGIISEGIGVLQKVIPILAAMGVKPHNSGEGGLGADPAGSDNITGV